MVDVVGCKKSHLLPVFLAVTGLAACSSDGRGQVFSSGDTGVMDDGASADDDGTADGGFDPCGQCEDDGFVTCDAQGVPNDTVPCGDQICVTGVGCVDCSPGGMACKDNGVVMCNDDGTLGDDVIEQCDTSMGEVCSNGVCADACQVAEETPSNVGCVFWAADLPNVREPSLGAKTPWGVALANASDLTATVVIERNFAAVGEPENLVVVGTETVPPKGLKTIELPRAEVTGWEPGDPDPGDPEPTITAKTNNAFRITTNAPIVVYQFNSFTNEFSTDASLLLPQNGLGKIHRVISYPSSKPIEVIPLPATPDYSFVTIIGVEDGTQVSFRPTAPTLSDMKSIPVGMPGDTITVNLDKWQTVNFGGEGIDNDLTGSVVESSKPVAVFTGTEGSVAPALGLGEPHPPGDEDMGSCCVDHLEEQVFPAESLGSDFVITRSPPRSMLSIKEPDEYRVLAVAEPATVTTNLPPPNDSFTIQPGDSFDFYTDVDFVAQSTAPVQIAQILLSQDYTLDGIGDPALTIFPPAEQWREVYVFLTPPTWQRNYFVIARPKGGSGGGDQPGTGDIKLDGGALPQSCVYTDIGELEGVTYESIRCPVDEGQHVLESDIDFGLTAYGYGSAGSYAYAGGADVRPIYTVPPVP